MSTETYCTKKDDIRTEEHFAIIEFDSIYVPGDERSKTCPGHGYPEHYESRINYISYTDENEWKEEIKRRQAKTSYGEKQFIACKVIPAKITTEINVSL